MKQFFYISLFGILLLACSNGTTKGEREESQNNNDSFCPNCKSKDFASFVYGLLAVDSAMEEAIKNNRLIRGQQLFL